MKTCTQIIIALGICAIQPAAALVSIGDDCAACPTLSCTCSSVTHKYCCPADKLIPSCPSGWSIDARCSTCTRSSITESDIAKHRYTTTTYSSCLPTTTTKQCLQSTATDTCGKKIMCQSSIIGGL